MKFACVLPAWLIACAAAVALSQPPPPLSSGLDPRNFDTSVRPQDDLFRHVNGRWLDRTPIPSDRVSWGVFPELSDKTEADLRVIIEGVAADRDRRRGSARQIADLYASLMNQARTEELDLEPARRDLERIDAVRSTRQLAEAAGYLSSIAAGGPFHGAVEEDPREPGKPVVTISQGGTLLPEREYYLSSDVRYVEIRAKYLEYLAHIFRLANRPRADDAARAVLAVETEIARVLWTQQELRDPARVPAKHSLVQLAREMPGFDWIAWARPQGMDVDANLVLSQPGFFRSFAALVPTQPIASWQAWLAARYLTASAPFLTKALSDARFEFFGRVLTGQELPRTHWKRGVSLVNSFLGDAVGRLYVEKHFPPSAKAHVERIVSTLIAAFREAIGEAGWMSDRAKRSALDKLSKLSTKIGYPDRWRDYSALVIKPDDLFGNVRRARHFENQYQLQRQTRPTDRAEWLMTVQTINAYYSPATNEVVVPAAMLQPPLFTLDADDAVNYGAIGAIVGHEIGHGFDERGRQFDGRGEVRNWWTMDDERGYATLGRALVEQYNQYSPLDGARVNGLVTLRENVGDLSGLAIAWRAYRIARGGKPAPVIDGFSGEQRFFLGWAQAWRGRVRDEYLRQTLFSTPHAPPQYRANGPVSNLAGFYEAFSVKPGDRMYREPSTWIRIW